MCDTITPVHRGERTGRQQEGWCVTREPRETSPKASLCLFSRQPPSGWCPRVSTGFNKELGGAIHPLGQNSLGPREGQTISSVVLRLLSDAIYPPSIQRRLKAQALLSWGPPTAHCVWFVVLRKGVVFPPKAMQFTGQSEEVTGMEESESWKVLCLAGEGRSGVGKAHTAAWRRGQIPAGPHLPGVALAGPAAAPGAGKQCSSELETSLKILFALTLRNSLEFCFLDLIPRVRFLESLT